MNKIFSYKFADDGHICQSCPEYVDMTAPDFSIVNAIDSAHGHRAGKVVEVELIKHDFPHGGSEHRWQEKK